VTHRRPRGIAALLGAEAAIWPREAAEFSAGTRPEAATKPPRSCRREGRAGGAARSAEARDVDGFLGDEFEQCRLLGEFARTGGRSGISCAAGRLKQSGHGQCEALVEEDGELGLGQDHSDGGIPTGRWYLSGRQARYALITAP
jgi:hypothetical protein